MPITEAKTKIETEKSLLKTSIDASHISEYGNKSLNLIKLQSILAKEFVPEFLPLSNQQMQNIFKALKLDINDAWSRFVKVQTVGNENSSAKILSNDARKELASIRAILIQASQSPLFVQELQKIQYGSENLVQWLEKQAKTQNPLMVRSTGNEDSQTIANPGGNESIASVRPDFSAIAIAIGQVLASYFSEKSMEQRLHAGDKITVLPICAVLLQKMIGETSLDLTQAKQPAIGSKHSQDKQNKDFKDLKYCSGVVYTRESEGKTPGLMVMQSTYGHGEGVVQSLVPTDTFYIDQRLFIDSTVLEKTQRIASVKTSQQSSKLDKVDNIKGSAMDPSAPSLTEIERKALYELCLKISKDKQYENQSLDIEWVLANGQFYIVQVRPTPESAATSKPSYVRNVDARKILAKVQLIVSAGNAVLSVNKSEEIIARKTIKAAWNFFSSLKNSEIIKFILIEEEVNTTSHYAGFFRSISLPVARLASIKEFEERIKNNPQILFDIQNSLILQGQPASFEIMSGWCRHPINMPLSLYPIAHIREMIQCKEKILQSRKNVNSAAGMTLAPLVPDLSLISVVNKVSQPILNQKVDKEVTEKISSNSQPSLKLLLQQLVSSQDPKIVQNILKFLVKKINFLQKKLHSKILKAELAVIYENLIAACEALLKVMSTQTALSAAVEPSMQKLYAIHRLEQLIYQIARTDMVNIMSIKTILSEFGEDQIANTIIENSIKKLTTHYPLASKMKEENDKIVGDQRELVLQILKFGKLIFSVEKRAQWELFVVIIALNPEPKHLQRLARLLKFLQSHQVAQEWLNTRFDCHLPEYLTNKKMTRQKLIQNMNRFLSSYIKDFKNASFFNQIPQFENTIRAWEPRIDLWGTSANFDKLFKEFTTDFISACSELVKILEQKNGSPLEKTILLKLLNRAMETYDLSLKAISSSSSYMSSPILRTENFRTLLKDYLKMSHTFCLLIPELLGLKVEQQLMSFSSVQIWNMANYCKKVQTYLAESDQLFASDKKTYAEKLMKGSAQFYVNAAVIGSRQDYDRAFHTNNTGYTLSYEDLFTLGHQNLVDASSVLYAAYGVSEQGLPPNLTLFAKAIRETQTKTVEYGLLEYQTQLIGIQLAYPTIEIKYNIPMRQHSGTVKIDYNGKTSDIFMTVAFYMMGEGQRKKDFIEITRLYSAIHGLELVKHPILPKYEGVRSFSEQSFTWKISANDLSKVKLIQDCIKDLIASTTGCPGTPVFPQDKFIPYPSGFFDEGLSGASEFFVHYQKHKKEKELCELLYSLYMRMTKSYHSEDAYELKMIGDSHNSDFFKKTFEFVCERAVSGSGETQKGAIRIIKDIFLDKQHACNFFAANCDFRKQLLDMFQGTVYYKEMLECLIDFFKSPNALNSQTDRLLTYSFFKSQPKESRILYFNMFSVKNPNIIFGAIGPLTKGLQKENVLLLENTLSRIAFDTFQLYYPNILNYGLQSVVAPEYKALALFFSQHHAIRGGEKVLQFLNYIRRFDLIAEILEQMILNTQYPLVEKYILILKEKDQKSIQADVVAGDFEESGISSKSYAIDLEQKLAEALEKNKKVQTCVNSSNTITPMLTMASSNTAMNLVTVENTKASVELTLTPLATVTLASASGSICSSLVVPKQQGTTMCQHAKK